MKKLIILFSFILAIQSKAQVTCESVKTPGSSFSLTACKSGKAKLFHTDTAITNKFKYRQFDVRLVSQLSATEQEDIKKYKFPLNPSDSVIMYDWDILHQAKTGYFGPAVGRVKINCKDSTVVIYKYLLRKDTKDYVPTHFKILRMGADNFILIDTDHPYLNINYYFKKK